MEIKLADVTDAPIIHELMIKAFLEYKDEVPPSSALEESVESISMALIGQEMAFIAYTDEQQLGYLLENCSRETTRPILSDEKLAQILFAFETMANAATRNVSPKQTGIPEIEDYPSIHKEIQFLQKELAK